MMQSSICPTKAVPGRFHTLKTSRPIAAPTTHPARSVIVPRVAVDQASVEVTAALTAILASGAALFSLASIIRSANGFDARDSIYSASSIASSNIIDYEKVALVEEESSQEDYLADDLAPLTPIALSSVNPTIDDEEHKNGEEKAKEEEKEEEDKDGGSIDEAIAVVAAVDVTKDHVEDIPFTTVKVTEPTLPQPNPAMAAAVLEILTADAPVGATAPGVAPNETVDDNNRDNANDVEERELVGALASIPTSPSNSADEAAEAAREYQTKVNKVLADAKFQAAVASRIESAQSQASAQRNKRLVTITEQYQEKIDALWASYEQKKVQEAALLSKQEKLTLDLAKLEEKQNVAAKAVTTAASANYLVLATRKIVAIFVALWRIVLAFVSKITRGSAKRSPSGGTSV